MDDSGHRENGRQKQQQPQGQWMMQHHPSMKQIIAIMAERDAALQERNLAISEKKAALAERDLAILQRDSAIAERNNAIMERDNTIAALQYRESAMSSGNNNNSMSSCPPGCQVSHGVKHIHHQHQLQHHHMEESSYNNMSRDLQISEGPPLSPVASEPAAKSRQTKRPKEEKPKAPKKKPAKPPSKKVKKEGEDLNKMMFSHDWGMEDDHQNKQQQLTVSKTDWKGQDLGLNQVAFDESMPVPVCSCTGVLRPCYRWGSGGWQSSCCTTTVSMYPLPAAPNKRHARVGGRKMSGNVFTKLLNRLAGEGHDLSRPVDLKEHWAKHGTNRYITIK